MHRVNADPLDAWKIRIELAADELGGLGILHAEKNHVRRPGADDPAKQVRFRIRVQALGQPDAFEGGNGVFELVS
jgi:hypothetical protein